MEVPPTLAGYLGIGAWGSQAAGRPFGALEIPWFLLPTLSSHFLQLGQLPVSTLLVLIEFLETPLSAKPAVLTLYHPSSLRNGLDL